MSEEYKRFVREFRRVTFGLDVFDMAEDLGVSAHTIYNWFSLKSSMNAECMLKIIKLYKINLGVIA